MAADNPARRAKFVCLMWRAIGQAALVRLVHSTWSPRKDRRQTRPPSGTKERHDPHLLIHSERPDAAPACVRSHSGASHGAFVDETRLHCCGATTKSRPRLGAFVLP